MANNEDDEQELFGFTVQHTGGDRWWVSLPHQCAEWTITGDGAGYGERADAPHAQAMVDLARFIAEANVALVALHGRNEVK